jgi:DNA mismatch endonuclease, patch repair protein
VDVFSRQKRSLVMAAIRAKHTKPETLVRRTLHLMGYRFRLHDPRLPGKPDIVLSRIRTIVQVKGCFWHGHYCLRGRVPGGNRSYWLTKISGNRSRDLKNERKLRRMGWRVVTLWECNIRRSTPNELCDRIKVLLPLNDVRRTDDMVKAKLEKLSTDFNQIRSRRTSSKGKRANSRR